MIMELGLEGKKVFISGSSRGIGLATAESFLSEGADVIINGRGASRLMDAYKMLSEKYPGHVYTVTGDLTDKSETDYICAQIKEIMPALDIFVANLGTGKPETPNALDVEEWKRFYDINVLSNIALLNGIMPMMEHEGEKNIVFISSIVAREKMSAPYGYAAAKSAILTLIKNLSYDLADKGFRVNGIMPGNILFPGGRWEELMQSDPKGVAEYIENNVPLKRFGTPREIADAVVFLCSERAAFITGASLVVDGGQMRMV